MPRFADIVTDQSQVPVAGAFVTVKNLDGSLAAITFDNGSAITNSVCTTDANGAYYFNGAASVYTLEFRISLSDSPVKIREVALVDEATVGITPESQGAAGDGLTNDTVAFQKLAALVQAAGGGVVDLRPGATYVVGKQDFVNSGIYMWKGQAVFALNGCTKPIIIRGNGAKLQVAAGLKYGTFDSSGNPTSHTLPWSSSQACTTSPDGIVSIQNCTAHVTIQELEIDGNGSNLNWGGQWGNSGWQLPADLIFLWGNTGGITLDRCNGHHGSRDGLQTVFGTGSNAASGYSDRVHLKDCTFEYNNRNNWSSANGNGCEINNCSFKHAGRLPGVPSTVAGVSTPTYSSPASNIDLEAFVAANQIRNFRFRDCELIDAAGNSLNADGGDISDVSFEGCRFIGTGSWALWMVKPWFRFKRCFIAGGVITNLTRILTDYGTPPADAAPVFEDCQFTDDPTTSPTGTLFTGVAGCGAVDNGNTDLGETTFRRCSFRAGFNAYMFSTIGGHFEDCNFTNGSMAPSFVSPHLSGDTVITDSSGNFPLFSSPPTGKWGSNITVGGVQKRRGTATWDPPSIAAGARATTTVSVPWARFRDTPRVTLSESLQGLTIGAYVSTAATNAAGAGVVTVTLDNFTGGAVDLASATLDVALIDRELV